MIDFLLLCVWCFTNTAVLVKFIIMTDVGCLWTIKYLMVCENHELHHRMSPLQGNEKAPVAPFTNMV